MTAYIVFYLNFTDYDCRNQCIIVKRKGNDTWLQLIVLFLLLNEIWKVWCAFVLNLQYLTFMKTYAFHMFVTIIIMLWRCNKTDNLQKK